MARLECNKCKSVYQDVIRVRKCPLCGSREFKNIEAVVPISQFSIGSMREGNIGFSYYRTIRADEWAEF